MNEEHMPMFERELVTKFRLDKNVRVMIFANPGESFSETLDRTAARVQKAIARYGLKDCLASGESLISGAQYSHEWGWTYSVRVQGQTA